MDIFKYRDDLHGDYDSYVKRFLEIQDQDLENCTSNTLDGGILWPEPLVHLKPAFLPGSTIDDLVGQDKLNPVCKRIFWRGKTPENHVGSPLHLHRHQEHALACAQNGANYVLTTRTGSGKSLTDIILIVDHVLKNGSGKGVQAIIVYPMNAFPWWEEHYFRRRPPDSGTGIPSSGDMVREVSFADLDHGGLAGDPYDQGAQYRT